MSYLRSELKPIKKGRSPEKMGLLFNKKIRLTIKALKYSLRRKPRYTCNYITIVLPDYISYQNVTNITHWFNFIPFTAEKKEILIGDELEPRKAVLIKTYHEYEKVLSVIIPYLLSSINTCLREEANRIKILNRKRRRKAKRLGHPIPNNLDARNAITSLKTDLMNELYIHLNYMRLEMSEIYLAERKRTAFTLNEMKREFKSLNHVSKDKAL